MTGITLEGVAKRYGSHAALTEVGLDFTSGSFTALLGPSGCGKTTILRLIAGFETPTAGRIRIGGDLVSSLDGLVPPEERGLGIVFQSYALWPHMSVAENVAYPLKVRGRPKADVAADVAATLHRVGLGAFADRRPDALSGGQRQRVALARATVAETRAILFDEPLANLDVHLRARMVEDFRRLHRDTGRTMVYVTHDQAEAIALADRLVVMDAGRVLQVGEPRTVYREPACETVAHFIGRGTVLDGMVEAVDGSHARVRLAGAVFDARCRADTRPGPARLLIRPEALVVDTDGDLEGTVSRATYRGPVTETEIALGDGGVLLLDIPDTVAEGTRVRLRPTDAWIVPALS